MGYFATQRKMKAFISHSSTDKPLVREIADEIRVRGHEVWLDERDLVPGQSLASALSNALEYIDIFIIVLTKNSVSSRPKTSVIRGLT
jgi:uncharacterized membrane protein YecN with MAPEG domain